jgi:hypothetical protein
MPTVTVACKLPNGLQLKLEGKPPVELLGNSVPFGVAPRDIGGYALTHGVDAEFFEAWITKYKDYEPVKRGLVFAYTKEQDARARALEMREEKSGLEPVDQRNPGPGLEPVGA